MLAIHTPAPHDYNNPMNNDSIDKLTNQRCYEIVRWPAYYSDEQCMNMLRTNTDPNVILYIALMKGITPIVTVGQFKSFVANFQEILPDKKHSRRLPRFKGKIDKLEKEAKKLFKR